jgi:anti-sigma-K factor RskA
MRYDQPELQESLSGEYVLGTLSGPARARFERLMRQDARLRGVVARWEARLGPLAQGVKPVEPPAYVWERIAAQTGIASGPRLKPASSAASWWDSLGFWRAFAGFATAAAFALVVYIGMLAKPEPVPTVITLAVLADQSAKPVMVISAEPKSHTLFVTPVSRPDIAADRDYELWALPENAAPKSLGVVKSQGVTQIKLPEPAANAVKASKAMAISVEPKGGSPTGAPTGPVVYQGAIVSL